MKSRKRLLTIALTAALGLGVWTLAVSFTHFSFSDGDTLSAQELNDLLNDNFDAAADAITANETAIKENATATATKVNKAGDSMTGRLRIDTTSSDATLYLKNRGTGPILQALSGTGYGASITNAGDIHLGPFSGTSADPTIRLEAETGDIMLDGTIRTNDARARSLLPVAIGNITGSNNPGVSANKSTANVLSVERVATGEYIVRFAPGTLAHNNYPVVIATAHAGNGTRVLVTADPTPLRPNNANEGLKFWISMDGAPFNPAGFSFLVYNP